MFAIFTVRAQEAKPQASAEELAKKLANPIASLISVPIQCNLDYGIGDLKGSRMTTNVQPVVPVGIGSNLNLILRWVQPIVSQYNISGEGTSQSGLADAVVSAFFSPANSSGMTWGAGPVFLVPDGAEKLSGKKLGVGPTAVALKQSKGMTFGALVNQVWSVSGDASYSDISRFFLQPFFTYNWKSGAGLGCNFEWTQDWKASASTLWFNPLISGVTSLGKQKTQLAIGPRFNLAAPDGTKADFGVRAAAVFLFPR
jgi:hypothetical protein